MIHDERAAVIGRLVVLHDVTERARLVRELHAYARTVAHDLKNPLSGAIGFLDLVKEAEPDMDDQSQRLLGEAYDTCYRMVDIITDLLRSRPARNEAAGSGSL
jgi:signal transduction histidine kinase